MVDELAAAGVGFETNAGPVPIVVGLSLFDLGVGASDVRPGPAAGRRALAAGSGAPEQGSVGAGTGATVGKWRGPEHAAPGGLGIHVARRGELRVAAIVAVNAAGDIDDGSLADTVLGGDLAWPVRERFGNTTIGVVATNAALTKADCLLVAQGAHDGLARAVMPAHLRSDGDAFVAAATGPVAAMVDEVRLLAVVATEQAIRGAVDTLGA